MNLIERLNNGVPIRVDRWAGNDGDRTPMIGEAGDTMREAASVIANLLDVLQRVAMHTDPDNTENYRSDDREGCLDTVHAISGRAVKEWREKNER